MSNYSSTDEVFGTSALTAAIIAGSVMLLVGAFASLEASSNVAPAAASSQAASAPNEVVVVTAARLHKDS